MTFAHQVASSIGRALTHVHAGRGKLASRKLALGEPTIRVTSLVFHDGERLALSSTADGGGLVPPIEWEGIPPITKSIVVIVEDPDAPFPKPFVHWLVYGIGPTAANITGAPIETYVQGRNSALKIGFAAAAPPPGHGRHRYHFQVFALDVTLNLAPGAGRTALLDRMRSHVLAWGEMVGTYERM